MSIQTAIQAAQQKVSAAYTAASAKGATMPATQDLSNLATTISTISGGTSSTVGWIPKAVDEDGKLIPSSVMPNFTGVTDISDYGLYHAFWNNKYLSGEVDMSSLTTVSGEQAMQNCFDGCENLTSVDMSSLTTVSSNYAMQFCFQACSNLTSIDLSSLTTVSGSNAMRYAFTGCTSLTSVDLSSLTTVSGSNAMNYVFQECTGLTSVDLSSLSTISDSNGMGYAFYNCTGLRSISFPALTEISTSNALYCACYGCTSLTSVDLSSLTTITVNSGIGYAFQGCTSLTSVDLSSLSTIGGTCIGVFKGCTSLTSISFPALTNINAAITFLFQDCVNLKTILFPALETIGNNSYLASVLSGVTGCTVVFPPELESQIGTWTNILNGLGGTNTRIIFGHAKVISVSIPQGYTVFFNGSDITNKTDVLAIVGENEVIGIDDQGRGFKYNFVADSETTEFTPDVSTLTFNEITLYSDAPEGVDVTYSSILMNKDTAFVYGPLSITDDKFYSTDGFSCMLSGEAEGYESIPIRIIINSSYSQMIQMIPESRIVTIDSTNIMSLATGDTQYLSVDPVLDGGVIKYGNPSTYVPTASIQIPITVPQDYQVLLFKIEARVSTEANYDFGYIVSALDRVTPTYTQVKNGTGITDGAYIYKDSGLKTEYTKLDTNYGTGGLNQVLNIGIAEDTQIKGDNMMYIKKIKIYFHS